ncbi:MAG: hypothetical protein IT462_02405 [Planctomycetes bacterium]|nr:hypothetical protein [Planctomycetota bacterium]
MNIPIANIYYLLLYAWDFLDVGDAVAADVAGPTTLMDLFARVLIHGMDDQLRRGLRREYATQSEQVAGLRGRIDFGESVKALVLPQGRTFCRFDDLNHDTLSNQIVRTTILRLLRRADLDEGLAAQLSGLDRRLRSIGEIPLNSDHFHSAMLQRSGPRYALLLRICRFIFDHMFPDQRDGSLKFSDFSDTELERLFEAFVRNFYRRECRDWYEGDRHFNWHDVEASDEDLAFLPRLETDVTLCRDSRVVVIDAKFYGQSLAENRFGGNRVRSDNLNQLYIYVVNMLRRGDPLRDVEGILLYPTVDRTLDLEYRVHGQRIRVCTVDLNCPWPEVRRRLMGLLPA